MTPLRVYHIIHQTQTRRAGNLLPDCFFLDNQAVEWSTRTYLEPTWADSKTREFRERKVASCWPTLCSFSVIKSHQKKINKTKQTRPNPPNRTSSPPKLTMREQAKLKIRLSDLALPPVVEKRFVQLMGPRIVDGWAAVSAFLVCVCGFVCLISPQNRWWPIATTPRRRTSCTPCC
jgi:hypothetical protein